MLNLIYSIVILLNNKNIYYKYIDDNDKFYSSFEIRTMLCSIFPIISAVLLFVICSNMNKFIGAVTKSTLRKQHLLEAKRSKKSQKMAQGI